HGYPTCRLTRRVASDPLNMTDSSSDPRSGLHGDDPLASAAGARPAIHRIVVPPDVSMVALLGARDDVLRAIERSFPRTDIHVRGNEIQVGGPHGEVALVERLVDELLDVVGSGQSLTADAVERATGMLR